MTGSSSALRAALVVMALSALAGCGRYHFSEDERGDGASGDGADGAAGGTARVTVSITGDGAVAIGTDWCLTTCQYDVPIGTIVQPMRVPRDGSAVVSDTFACQNPECALVADLSFSVAFGVGPITANRVFITSTTLAPPFGGLAGADAFCAQRATATGLTGAFVALLPTSTTTIPARLAGSRGWVRLDGVAVFDQPADVFRNQFNPIAIDDANEFFVDTALAASGADDNGAAMATRTCTNWTVTTGSSETRTRHYSGAVNSTNSGAQCNVSLRMFCAETGKQVAVAPTPWPFGRYVFSSTSAFSPASGVAAADLVCANQAGAAGLPGTYRALIATSTASIVQRVGSLAGPWRLPNGVRVSRIDLENATAFDAPINVTATGATALESRVWIGAPDLVTAGTAATTCNDWSTAAGTGTLTRSFTARFDNSTLSCGLGMFPVYCAQM
jgi:hypothetical protein